MYNTKTKRTVIPTPPTATVELHNSTVSKLVAHYEPILTPTLLITHRKGCYAVVINSTISGVKLEQLLGTDNAKVATAQILDQLTTNISTIA